MEIKVLGPGCPNCKALEKSVNEAVTASGKNIKVTKVDDIMKIIEYGVMRSPALVVNEKVVVSGRVPSRSEIDAIISKM